MRTLVFSHPDCIAHDPGPGHPESPARLKAVMAALQGIENAGLGFEVAPEANESDLLRVHKPNMVEEVLLTIPAAGYAYLDHETIVSPGSRAAALRAAGAGIAAVDAVVAGTAVNAFCAVRPPGHHATHNQSMGFCLFNNIAVAAIYARAVHKIARVAVLDFDVHHGNGTQDILREADDTFYGSSHEYPNYPGSGTHSEDGPCTIINAPLPPMTTSDAFRAAWRDLILPELAEFGPDLILVSAGFDGHRKDPLSMMQLEVADYGWLTTEIRHLAERHCDGRLVSMLEGGYDLDALAASARAHVEALLAP